MGGISLIKDKVMNVVDFIMPPLDEEEELGSEISAAGGKGCGGSFCPDCQCIGELLFRGSESIEWRHYPCRASVCCSFLFASEQVSSAVHGSYHEAAGAEGADLCAAQF